MLVNQETAKARKYSDNADFHSPIFWMEVMQKNTINILTVSQN